MSQSAPPAPATASPVSAAGREVLACLRINGLTVRVEQTSEGTRVHVNNCRGERQSTEAFGPARERDALLPLVQRYCTPGQWVRMSWYDTLSLAPTA